MAFRVLESPRKTVCSLLENNGPQHKNARERPKWFVALTFAGECQWLHLELIKEMHTFCKTLFPVVDYAYCTIPTYPSGQIGFMLCSKNPVSDTPFSPPSLVYLPNGGPAASCPAFPPRPPHRPPPVRLQVTDFRKPARELPREELERMNLKYYNVQIHSAAFVLPEFARKVWGGGGFARNAAVSFSPASRAEPLNLIPCSAPPRS